MTGGLGALVGLAAVLVATAPAPRRVAARRLAHVRDATCEPNESQRTGGRRRPEEGSTGTSARLRFLGAAGAAGVVLLVLGAHAPAVAGATAVGALAWWTLGRLEPAGRRRARERVVRDLPFAVDLFASCLAAGASTPHALRLAGDGVGGPVGEALGRASASLVIGAPTSEAVSGWSVDPVLAVMSPLARLLVRSAVSGTALVPAATRLASDLRASRRWAVDAVARRVGVRATAPLGACFLPAFVLLGIVPLVVSGGRAAGL